MSTPTKIIVWHVPTDKHIVCDEPSQVSDFVNSILGRPSEGSVEVIPKDFHVYNDVPYHALGAV